MGSKPVDLRVEMADLRVEMVENRGHFRRKSPPGAGCWGPKTAPAAKLCVRRPRSRVNVGDRVRAARHRPGAEDRGAAVDQGAGNAAGREFVFSRCRAATLGSSWWARAVLRWTARSPWQGSARVRSAGSFGGLVLGFVRRRLSWDLPAPANENCLKNLGHCDDMTAWMVLMTRSGPPGRSGLTGSGLGPILRRSGASVLAPIAVPIRLNSSARSCRIRR
jgi:hypothetical protein